MQGPGGLNLPPEVPFSNLVVREDGPAKDGGGCVLMDEGFAGLRQDANDRDAAGLGKDCRARLFFCGGTFATCPWLRWAAGRNRTSNAAGIPQKCGILG